MTAISENPVCPRCGSPVPSDAPAGECPKCLLGAVAAPAEPPALPPVPGEWPTLDEVRAAFPDLDIDREIGRGGMAIVFKARQLHLDRPVALKILAPWLAAEPGFAERFSREARVLARLNHPNIVIIHDFGQAARFFYLLMEYMDGVNLRQAMQAGRFTPEQALGLVPRICDALQYAHGEGVLHRDIKPDNILLDGRGRVKIADFGIAKLAGEPEAAFSLTRSGMRLGTPAYMAPEQVEKPGDVDHRADIYSLGVVLYEMLTGELPLGRFAAPSEKSSVDARIDEIVFRTLEKERERRYQSAEEVKTRVEGLGHPPPPPPPAAPVVAAAAAPAARGLPMEGRPSIDDPLSHKALAGAVATGLSLCVLAVLVPTWTMPMMRVSHGPMDSPPSWSPAVPMALMLLLVLAGLAISALSGVILGASALSDIHRSGGRRRGAGLATFAVLAWPLLLFTGVGAGISAAVADSLFESGIRVSPHGSEKKVEFVAGLAVVLWLGVVIVRRTLRWANGARAEAGVPPPSTPTAATVVSSPPLPTSGLAVASGILAIVSFLPLGFMLVFVIVGLLESNRRGGVVGVALGTAEMMILVLISGLPGLIGTILGVSAMRRLRDSGGRLGGVHWAVLGGMSWPVLLLGLLWLMGVLMVVRSVQSGGAGVIAFVIGLGVPVVAGLQVFRAAAAWTRGGNATSKLTKRDGCAVGLLVVVLALAGTAAVWMRTRGRSVSTTVFPAAVYGDFRVDGSRARVQVNESRETTEWTQARPVQVQRLELTMAATLAQHAMLVCEIRHTLKDGREATVRRLEDATMLTGALVDGEITVHRHFTLELPEGSGNDALQDAHRQINSGWLHRGRAVLLARPEPLFRVTLPDGSTFEAAFILQPASPPVESTR